MAIYTESNTDPRPKISDYGFNKALTRDTDQQAPPDMLHTFADGIGINATGSQEMGAALSLGYQYISVEPTQDIQVAINKVSERGGGIVRLLATRYRLTKDISIPSNVTLQGDGREGTILDFLGNAVGIKIRGVDASNLVTHARLRDLVILSSGDANAGLDIDYTDAVTVDNVIVIDSDHNGIRIRHSRFFTFRDLILDSNIDNGILFETTTARSEIHFTLQNVVCQSNLGNGIKLVTAGSGAAVANGYFFGVRCNLNSLDGFDFSGALQIDSTFIGCLSANNLVQGWDIDVANCSFIGCNAESNTTGDGWEVSQLENKLIGCKSESNSVEYDFQSRVTFVGNSLDFGATIDPNAEFSSGSLNVSSEMQGNVGASPSTVRKLLRMKNGYSTTVGGGKTVAYDTTANVRGDIFTASFIAGDDRVCGMLVNSTAVGEWDTVLVEGFTNILQVNGTDDIAIGDYLSLHSANAVAKKAEDGDMAFAIALEAYTGNDSNGVIDALIITPRKLGSGGSGVMAGYANPSSNSTSSGSFIEMGNGTDGRVTLTTEVECKFLCVGTRSMIPDSDTGRDFELKIQRDSSDITGAISIAAIAAFTGSSGHLMPQTVTGVTEALAAGTYVFRMVGRSNSGKTVNFREGTLVVTALPTGN